MADLSRGGDGRDRGQLLLVAALAIAVAIVALVLLLNTSIYVENLATRDTDTGASEAIAFRNSVESNLWRVVAAENDRPYTNRTRLRQNVSNRTDRLVELTADRHRRDAVVAGIANENTTFDDGTRLQQTDETRSLTDTSGDPNWTLATGADGVRAFEVNTTGGLESTSSPETEAFGVHVVGGNGTGDTWSLYVYRYPANSTATLAVKNGSASLNEGACTGLLPNDPQANLTAGTVDGSECPELVFAKGTDPPYVIEYQYGNRSTGTYQLTVNTTLASAQQDSFNSSVSNTTPYAVPVVYGVRTQVIYRSPTLSYRANVTVPEEGS